MIECFKFLTKDKVIEINILALTIFDEKKADQPKVLSHSKLMDVLDGCESHDGDVHDKAVFLMKNLIKSHPFASGNRRTAFLAAKKFILMNKSKFRIKDDPLNARHKRRLLYR